MVSYTYNCQTPWKCVGNPQHIPQRYQLVQHYKDTHLYLCLTQMAERVEVFFLCCVGGWEPLFR